MGVGRFGHPVISGDSVAFGSYTSRVSPEAVCPFAGFNRRSRTGELRDNVAYSVCLLSKFAASGGSDGHGLKGKLLRMESYSVRSPFKSGTDYPDSAAWRI